MRYDKGLNKGLFWLTPTVLLLALEQKKLT
jgi:hypothetical protein